MNVVRFFMFFVFGMLLGACGIHYYEWRYWLIAAGVLAMWFAGFYEGKCNHDETPR